MTAALRMEEGIFRNAFTDLLTGARLPTYFAKTIPFQIVSQFITMFTAI